MGMETAFRFEVFSKVDSKSDTLISFIDMVEEYDTEAVDLYWKFAYPKFFNDIDFRQHMLYLDIHYEQIGDNEVRFYSSPSREWEAISFKNYDNTIENFIEDVLNSLDITRGYVKSRHEREDNWKEYKIINGKVEV